MGYELGNATDIGPLLVPSALSTCYTIFHLDRERRFLGLPYEFSIKMS